MAAAPEQDLAEEEARGPLRRLGEALAQAGAAPRRGEAPPGSAHSDEYRSRRSGAPAG